MPEIQRRSSSSIHNHNILPWCHYESYANNLGETRHLQQTCGTDRILPLNHECSQDGKSQDGRFRLYAEILVEANLVTSGCLLCVLSGKNYTTSLWCLKAVSEGLERLLLTAFMDDFVQDSPHHTSNIAALRSLGIVSP